MKDTVILKLRMAALVIAVLLIFVMASKAFADPVEPPILKEPPTITILDWCAGPAMYASGLVLSIRQGYSKEQVTQFMVEQMAAIKEQTGEVMKPDQLVTMIGILNKAYEVPKDEMLDLYGGANFVQEIADECAKKFEKLNEEAEKGLII